MKTVFTNDEVIREFIHGNTNCRNSTGSLYVTGDVLYSYGSHFPLLVRKPWGFLMNADRYSNTTSKHQSLCFRHATVQTSFRMLEEAGIDFKDLELIDTLDAYWVNTGRYRRAKTRWDSLEHKQITLDQSIYPLNISKIMYENGISSDIQEWYSEVQERRPQHSIFKARDKCYITGMDEQSYFISELAEQVLTVQEGFNALEPLEVTGKEFIRQGEWFFVKLPVSEKEATKAYNKILSRDYVLPKRDENSHDHTATRGGIVTDINFENPVNDLKWDDIVVSRCIRHPEHRMIKLDKKSLYVAYRNREVQSWSSGAMGVGID